MRVWWLLTVVCLGASIAEAFDFSTYAERKKEGSVAVEQCPVQVVDTSGNIIIPVGAPVLRQDKYDPETGGKLEPERDEVNDAALARVEAQYQALLDGVKAMRADLATLR